MTQVDSGKKKKCRGSAISTWDGNQSEEMSKSLAGEMSEQDRVRNFHVDLCGTHHHICAFWDFRRKRSVSETFYFAVLYYDMRNFHL